MSTESPNPWLVVREQCPVCRAAAHRTLHSAPLDAPPILDYLREIYSKQGVFEPEYLAGGRYTLLECAGCKLIYQREVPGDALMERIYEHWIDPRFIIDHRKELSTNRYALDIAREIMQLIACFDTPAARLKVLDYGMGFGAWALMARGFGCTVAGTELSPLRIEHARANGIEVLDGNSLPGASFDLINMEQVLEHLPDPLETVLQLKPALKPGGTIKVSVPTVRNIGKRIAAMDWSAPVGSAYDLEPVGPLEHINYCRYSSLVKLAEQAELEAAQIPLGIQYRYPGGWSGWKGLAKCLLRPLWRNVLKGQNFILLRKR